MGDEGRDFFLSWTHQSGKKQRVDRCVKRVLLGQLGNFRDQFRRLHKVSQKRRSNRLALAAEQLTTLMYKSEVRGLLSIDAYTFF